MFDSQDQCPTVAAGLNPDSVKPGCPLPDRDHDQIPDAVDACPDQVGAPSPDPKKNGCPGLVEIKGGQIIIKEQVFFATGKDVVLKKSFPLLDVVAHTLKTLPQIRRLGVEGHTDNKGKPEVNTALSDRRAKSVVQYLADKGVAPARMQAQGFGPSRPIADNKTGKGRALNRRVDFLILDPPQTKAATSAPAPAVSAPAPTPVPSAPAPKPSAPVAAPVKDEPTANGHHSRRHGKDTKDAKDTKDTKDTKAEKAAQEAKPEKAAKAPKEPKAKRAHKSKK